VHQVGPRAGVAGSRSESKDCAGGIELRDVILYYVATIKVDVSI